MAPALLKRGDLKRGEAVIWLPPRAAGERALGSEPSLQVMVADPSPEGVSLRRASLETLPALRSVRLVFDPRDVTLLAARLPALSPAKLQRALPNLLEDQVLQDAGQCAWAYAPGPSGADSLVGVIDHHWLETVVQAFERRDIKVVAAWAAQTLRLGPPSGAATLLCVGQSVALVTGAADGLGLSAGTEPSTRREAVAAALSLSEVRVKAGLTVLASDASWHAPAREAAAAWGIEPVLGPLPVPVAAAIDFMSARQGGALSRAWSTIDRRAWRVPGALALASVVIAIAGLNAHWWVLHQEQAALRARMDAAFAQVFAPGTARVDPVLQLRRHVATLRARAGQASSDDFVPLASALGLALGAQATDALAAIDYRDGRLKVRFRPGLADSRPKRDALEQAARRHGLRLQFDNEREPLATVMVLR